MATRNILHISKLHEFEGFLETKGYMIVATSKNPYEVLRAQKKGDTVVVYQKKDAKEHLSTMDKDYRLVREFIKSQKKQSNADHIRNMTDEELAKFICEVFNSAFDEMCEDYPCSVFCTEQYTLEWLKEQVEDNNEN